VAACGNEAASAMWKASTRCVSRKPAGELSHLDGYELFQFARYLRWIVGLLNEEMVRDGFYANRADFIRTAVRNQLERQDDAVRQSVARRQLQLGLSHYTRQDLEAARDAGTPLQIQVLGLASIASDVTPELARAGIASVQVLGAF